MCNGITRYYLPKDISRAIEFSERALKLGMQTKLVHHKLDSFRTRCEIADMRRDYYGVIRTAWEARKISRFTQDLQHYQFTAMEAQANIDLGNFSRALEICAQIHEELTVARMEDTDSHNQLVDVEATIHLHKSEYVDARNKYEIIAKNTSSTRAPRYHANSLTMMAYLNLVEGADEDIILAHLNAARAIYTSIASPRIALCSIVTAEMHLRHGDLDSARVLFEDLARGFYRDLAEVSLAALGDPRNDMCNPADTFRWAVVSFSLAQTTGARVRICHALRCLADIYAKRDENDTALVLFQSALEAATAMDIHRLRAECMTGIGDILFYRGDSREAKKMWEAAHPLFIRSSQMKAASGIHTRLDKSLSTGENSPAAAHAVGSIGWGTTSSLGQIPTSEAETDPHRDQTHNLFEKQDNTMEIDGRGYDQVTMAASISDAIRYSQPEQGPLQAPVIL